MHAGRYVTIAKEDIRDIAVYRHIGHDPAR